MNKLLHINKFVDINNSTNSWEEEWQNMPEYSNKEIEPYKTIKIHFKTEQDYDNFSKLIDQNLTEKTKSVWYPELVKGINSKLRYTDSNES